MVNALKNVKTIVKLIIVTVIVKLIVQQFGVQVLVEMALNVQAHVQQIDRAPILIAGKAVLGLVFKKKRYLLVFNIKF